MSLLDELETAGLTVRPNPGWGTATNKSRDRVETVGVVNHWDAIKGTPNVSYYTTTNRFGGILYHLVVRRDDSVDLLSQRYVWHAGKGDSAVLAALRAGETPPAPQDRYDSNGNPLTPTNSGNPYTFSVAVNYHPDDGPMPQYDALVVVNQVLLDHFSLTTNQVIDHRGWTTRKRDIDTIDIDRFRSDIGETMPLTDADLEAIRGLVREELDRWVDGRSGEANSFYGVGQRVATTLIGRSGRTVGYYLQKTFENTDDLALADHDHDGAYVKDVVVDK